jgi:dynein heavy chain 1
LEANVVFETLGDDLEQWSNVLVQVRKQRGLFDTTKTSQSFEALIVDFGHIQTKVNAQYDTWQRDLISRFSLKLSIAFQKTFKDIKSSRVLLEELLFSGSIDSIVDSIENLHKIGRFEVQWADTLITFETGQKILERQRYAFPNDWIYYDQLQGEFSAFKEIYKRKMKMLDESRELVQKKVTQANKTSYDEITSLIADWEINKPVKLNPTTALKSISVFEARFNDQKNTYNILCKAKVILHLDFITFDAIIPTLEELLDHKKVLENLSSIWLELDNLRNYFWCSQPEIRPEIDHLVSKLKQMPNRMRQYTVFQSLQTKIEQFSKTHTKSLPLKSDAIKDRHWALILSLFNLDSNRSILTIGQVWDSIPTINDKELDRIIQTAQGELALEKYLQTIKNFWDTCKFEFVTYQNLKLVKTFVEINSKTTDNLMVLQQMKSSPYYKTFQAKAEELETTLNRLFFLVELWQNVQQKWIYLQGVFGGENIKRILPIESTRFQRIDTEFSNLVRKTFKSPGVTDVLMIPNIMNIYERLWDLLVQVQKSLGEYLEKERESFKRFYFLSDDDLLEILGSKDIHDIQPLLKKMFPGTSGLIIEDKIIGVVSKDFEQVRFSRNVAYKSRLVYEWLTDVEMEVMSTLSDLLGQSIISFDFSERVELESFRTWLDLYPSQIILLTSQCQFTNQVEKSILEKDFEGLLFKIQTRIETLAKILTQDLGSNLRSKSESLITELVHQRDIVRKLCRENVSNTKDYLWLRNMRFYSVGKKVFVEMANARFEYGFEYLGIQDNLVETPLTDKCFLTLCQALDNKLGGSPFGPAGTGKVL